MTGQIVVLFTEDKQHRQGYDVAGCYKLYELSIEGNQIPILNS